MVASAAAKELVQLKRRKEKKVMLEEMKVRKAQGGYMNLSDFRLSNISDILERVTVISCAYSGQSAAPVADSE